MASAALTHGSLVWPAKKETYLLTRFPHIIL
jgi:hypothetical protein